MIPIKRGKQIEKMREAGRLACDILKRLAAMCAEGVTTRDVDQAAARMMAEAGCRSAFLGYKNFPGNICISINQEVVHGIGGPRRIRPGDIVKIDCGVIKDGWHGDNAITVPIPPVSEEVENLLAVTEDSLFVAIEHARAGKRLGDLCASVERHVTTEGYTVVRDLVGHGVGRRLHEDPQVPNYGEPGKGPVLRPGMTLAIEPMVNEGTHEVKQLSDGWTVVTKDGALSAHFEHTVLITKGDPEILTPRERTASKLVELV